MLAEKVLGTWAPTNWWRVRPHYAVDPLHASNQGITDLDLAPRNSAGKVEFSADFAMLRPVNPDQGNHRILFDVVNRGRKTALTLNSVPTATDPTAPPGGGQRLPDAAGLHRGLGGLAGRTCRPLPD